MSVELTNRSLCTSGHSKRYTIIENEKIPHIISISQSYGASTQISVIAPTTVDAGVWSTALLINPKLTLPAHIHMIHTISETV